MTIPTRDRKLIWARAGGTCTLCKNHVTADAKGADRDVVLGEEAHIVSEQPNGPRFRPMPLQEVDAYANLLLACPSDHKIIDEQVSYYTEQRLLTLKKEHEQWVKDHLSPEIVAIRIRDPQAGKPVTLRRMDSGKALMNALEHTLAMHRDHPEPQSVKEAELVGDFFQNISDCRDIWVEIELSEQIRAAFTISEGIDRLREAGLLVYAGVRNQIIEGGVRPPAPWLIAYVVLFRSEDEAIKADTNSEQSS